MNIINKMPLVTVAVPTYKRPELLRRALNSIKQQNYHNIEVVVSDNHSDNYRIEDIRDEFKSFFKKSKFVSQQENIGPTNNFLYCLEIAQGDFFMWLADDDEVSGENYISTLVDILISRSDAVTASGNWKLMTSPVNGTLLPPREYVSKYWVTRALKFIWFAHDDFFYGLHRTENLRKASIAEFSKINRDFVGYSPHPFLLDMVIQGTIVYDSSKSAIWINHEYSEKKYLSSYSRYEYAIRLIIRKLEVQYAYLIKIYNKCWFAAPFFLFFSLFTLLKDLFTSLLSVIFRRIKKIFLLNKYKSLL